MSHLQESKNERLLKNLEPLAKEYGSDILIECDVSNDDSIKSSFKDLANKWDNFDGFVHSIGYAPADQLEGDFLDVTNREGFKIAHDISSYSFTAMAKEAKPMLNENSALLTLTYLGSSQTMPNYNVMGLAKASLEANTRFLAASMGAFLLASGTQGKRFSLPNSRIIIHHPLGGAPGQAPGGTLATPPPGTSPAGTRGARTDWE